MRREAQCLAALCPHPNILAWHAAGVTQEGHGYLVLDYAALGSCRKRLRAKAFEVDEALSMGIALACALATAHRAGYLHRDIKPSNVLIAASGTPLLADFGICTSVYQPEDSPGFSLPWAPPEVASQASPGSEAGDIYSLAATLFALLCGQSPYEHAYRPRSHNELVRAMLTRATPVLDAAHAPPTVSRALRVAMSQDPGDRFVSALDFARALQHVQFACFHHVTPLAVDGAAPVPAELKCCSTADGRDIARLSMLELPQAAPCPPTAAHSSTTTRPSSSRAPSPQLCKPMPPPPQPAYAFTPRSADSHATQRGNACADFRPCRRAYALFPCPASCLPTIFRVFAYSFQTTGSAVYAQRPSEGRNQSQCGRHTHQPAPACGGIDQRRCRRVPLDQP
jgi:serine/threonine protein kinase